ncbi:hypothetical protein OB955_07965 [Halobacteria archaeon AArc-m2/3/4]|uniref:Uncharacterized protein n=1 Tax=Natronoglomus mannanivorans TaxID=2979990 RepID=A0AAP2YXM4_9EURY|nr:hypothetical protein [Halobacteria archaeon AArc-xg1-1]MCU4972673.1 hypothetical protein [Halobacteria archaeon AArc-m2/3/4]
MPEDECERTREREQEREQEQKRRECELCGTRVPAAVYREHVLKECPGEGE